MSVEILNSEFKTSSTILLHELTQIQAFSNHHLDGIPVSVQVGKYPIALGEFGRIL
jgi:hypothetical protein